jgi:hypothetical protein
LSKVPIVLRSHPNYVRVRERKERKERKERRRGRREGKEGENRGNDGGTENNGRKGGSVEWKGGTDTEPSKK